jgi:glucan phosphoethanolaminetransferase (alkaline phosphatase superfamily)
MYDWYAYFVFGEAAFSGLLFLVCTIVAIQKSSAFRRRWYWWLLTSAFGYCLLSPFIFMWTTPYQISVADAFFLRNLHAGSRRVAEGYSVFIGVVLGGLIGIALSRWLARRGRARKPLVKE